MLKPFATPFQMCWNMLKQSQKDGKRVKLKVNTLSGQIIGIYQHKFTKELEILHTIQGKALWGIEISCSLLVNLWR